MARPRLERLEGRFVPTALPTFAAPSEFAQLGMRSLDSRPVDSWTVSNPFAFSSPATSDAAFAMSRPVEPLIGQIGRLPEQSLEFAPSGHGGRPIPEELSLWQATAPLEAPPAVEQVDELFLAPEPEAAPSEE